MIEKDSRKIICTSFSKDKRHDFGLFKESKVHIIEEKIKVLSEQVTEVYKKAMGMLSMLHRKRKKNLLNKEKKTENQELSSKRMVIENVIELLKRFRIIADRYRNR